MLRNSQLLGHRFQMIIVINLFVVLSLIYCPWFWFYHDLFVTKSRIDVKSHWTTSFSLSILLFGFRWFERHFDFIKFLCFCACNKSLLSIPLIHYVNIQLACWFFLNCEKLTVNLGFISTQRITKIHKK